MQLTVLTFGQIATITGSSQLQLEETFQDTDALKKKLYALYPALQHTRHVLAVNRKIITENTSLLPGAVVALLPPFSGG